MKRSMILGWAGVVLAMALPAFADGATDPAANGATDAKGDRRAAEQAVATPGERVREARPAVAAPGQCAEPRAAVDARTGEGFSVVGPVTQLFDPIDVAAGPGIAGDASLRPPMPVARAMARPGACDQPGSGCGIVQSSSAVVEPPPGGGGFPSRGPN